MPISISFSPSSKVGLPDRGHRAGRQGHAHRAAIAVSLARQVGALIQGIAGFGPPLPTIFSISTVVPTPRRPAV